MLTFEGFTGINNVIPAHRLGKTDMLVASNVNIGLTGEITRRGGYAEPSLGQRDQGQHNPGQGGRGAQCEQSDPDHRCQLLHQFRV